MIALKNNLPLLRKPRGHARAFRRAWLRNALKRAAEKAGYSEWWIAEDLTQSVVFYLQHHYLQPVIAVPMLENAVRSALREIGYTDVASHFGSGLGVYSISLLRFFDSPARPDAARFFANLSAWFNEIGATPLSWVVLGDLEPCARALARQEDAKFSSDSAESVQTQIVEFIYAQLSLLHAEDFLREIHCSIQ